MCVAFVEDMVFVGLLFVKSTSDIFNFGDICGNTTSPQSSVITRMSITYD